MADNDAVSKALAADKERSEASRKEATEKLSKGKPTPTQEECDRAKLGEFVVDKEDDGSGPDVHHEKNLEVQRGGKPQGGYATRDMQPGQGRTGSAPAAKPKGE
jgi:hypothetical protein